MIGNYPVSSLAPLEYRFALDAAMSALAPGGATFVVCNDTRLVPEVRQRIPDWAEPRGATSALWIEPVAETWCADLGALGKALPAGGQLVVIASRPLARTLPERRAWDRPPLTTRPGGVGRVQCALREAGFAFEANYGIHSALAIGLSLASRLVAHWNRPDLADRLHFAARLRYCVAGPFAALSTVALLVARKGSGR